MGAKALKVVHISTTYSGGAGTAAYRLHEALLQSNVNSTFLSLQAPDDNKAGSCFQLHKSLRSAPKRAIDKFIRSTENCFKWKLSKYIYYKNRLKEISTDLHAEWTSLPFSAFNILNHEAVKEADIIHLHWVSGVLDYPSFFKNNIKPVIWTLHDLNPLQGIFHYKEDELRNTKIAGELDKEIHSIKERLIKKRRSSLAIVTPSKWLEETASKSAIFTNIFTRTIRNPISISSFLNGDSQALRNELGIPKNNTIFLFIAQAIENYRKGIDLLIEAFNLVEIKETTLLVIGDSYDLKIDSSNIINLGSVSDKKTLSNYYALADAFVIPSREDNLPNVMLEAMACGTPVLSFNVGGLAEIIEDNFNGLKASEVKASSLKNTIETFICNKNKFDSEAIKEFVSKNFSYSLISEEYMKVYENCMSN